MRHFSVFSLLLLASFILGCGTSNQINEDGEEGAVVQYNDVVVQQARVFVDGVDKGLTPTTVTINRRFGEAEILLRVGKERVRFFEIEQTNSSNSAEMAYSFRGTSNDGIYMTINVEDLPSKRKNDNYLYIPYTTQPMQIRDRDYGLDILVR